MNSSVLRPALAVLSIPILAASLATRAGGQILVPGATDRTQAQTDVPSGGSVAAATRAVHSNLDRVNKPHEYQSIPTSVRYEFFFRHVVFMNQDAITLDNQGKPSDAIMARAYHQKAANLLDSEASLLKAAAEDDENQVHSILAQEQDLVGKIRQQREADHKAFIAEIAARCQQPTARCPEHRKLTQAELQAGVQSGQFKIIPESDAVKAMRTRLAALEEQRSATVLVHVNQLKSQLSIASFQRLSDWVDTVTRSSITRMGAGTNADKMALSAKRRPSFSANGDIQ